MSTAEDQPLGGRAGTPAPTTAVTIAVVSWNTRDLLAECLSSMRADAERGTAEVWVVDNASTDGSAELVRERYPWVRLLALDDNLGFGRAVNRVAEEAGTPWIAAANADIELGPGALDALLEAGARDEQAGALAPRLMLPDGSVQPSLNHFPSLWRRVAFHLRLYRLHSTIGERMLLSRYWDPEHPRRVDWATGAFLVLRRSAFEQIGGFDDRQWMYAEDLDLCWRLSRAGWSTRYVPQAIVRHELSPAAAKAFGEGELLTERWMRATYAWMARRRGVPFTWAHAGIDLVEAMARTAALTVASAIAGERFEERLRAARGSVRIHRHGLRSPRTLRSPRW